MMYVTAREYLAGQALACMMSCESFVRDLRTAVTEEGRKHPETQERELMERILANRAVRLADAVVERLKPTPSHVEMLQQRLSDIFAGFHGEAHEVSYQFPIDDILDLASVIADALCLFESDVSDWLKARAIGDDFVSISELAAWLATQKTQTGGIVGE